VPATACRKLTGIESASISRSANATSTICSSLSPMPAIKPAHGEMPARLTASTVATRSSYVCVVVMFAWWSELVLRLWL
jgi:hypothetical protein